MLENFEDTVKEANEEMLSQTTILKEKMTGSKGVLNQISSSAETVTNSLNKASKATKELATETEKLFDTFNADNKGYQSAIKQVAEYEKELQKAENTASSLRQQLNNANKTIATKTAESANYKTQYDILAGNEDFKAGQKFKLSKSLYVYYAGDGNKANASKGHAQFDTEGNQGYTIPSGTEIEIFGTHQQVEGENREAYYPISIFSAGKKPASSEKDNSTKARQNEQM